MPQIFHPQFREDMAPVRYPFGDTCNLAATSGRQISNDTILDASIYPIGSIDTLRISKIVIEVGLVTIYVGDSYNEELAAGAFDPLSPPVRLDIVDFYGRPAGVLVCDPVAMSVFQSWALDTHTFLKGSADFVASCVIPTPEVAVRAILLEDGSFFTGDVWLIGEDGVVIREEAGNIRIDMVGDVLYKRKLCLDAGRFATPRFLKTINQIPPNAAGNFQIEVDETPAEDTILRILSKRDIMNAIFFNVVGRPIMRAP